jgi:hypothetical protein
LEESEMDEMKIKFEVAVVLVRITIIVKKFRNPE